MRKYAWILVLAFLLSACSAGPSFARTPEEERTPLQYVCMEDTFFVGSVMEDFYKEAYALEDRYEDEKLQEMIASVELDYPIDTQEEINTISWALYDIGVSAELIDPELKPNSAERYAEGIWHFTFNKATADMLCYTGDQVSFLISGEDGHIITLRTEMLFLDPFSSSSWEMYNGSDSLPEGERRPLKAATWHLNSYNDQRYATEEHSADEVFDDSEWQAVAAGNKASYPLLELEDITAWAWDFAEAAAEAGLIDPQVYPWFATHYGDGIWEMIFDAGTYLRPIAGMRLTVLISDADGHIIAIDHIN